MSHESTPTMTASWTTPESAHDDATVAMCGPRDAYEHALGDALSELDGFDMGAPVSSYDDRDTLDAHALFADLPLAPVAAPQNAVFHASPYLALPAPCTLAPTMTTMRRSTAPTMRLRRAPALRTPAAAIALCGVLALIATLAACIFYVGSPQRAPRTAAAAAPLRSAHVPATQAASKLVTSSATERDETPADIELDTRAATTPAAAPAAARVAHSTFAMAVPASAEPSAKNLDDVLAALSEEQLRR